MRKRICSRSEVKTLSGCELHAWLIRVMRAFQRPVDRSCARACVARPDLSVVRLDVFGCHAKRGGIHLIGKLLRLDSSVQ